MGEPGWRRLRPCEAGRVSEHPIDLSTRIIDTGILDTPPNRITEGVSELTDNVAIVESFSHSVVVDTGAGLVISDTSVEGKGPAVVEAIRSWSTNPVDTIVYTHGHLDHVGAVLVTLPVGAPAWERRVQLVRDRMHRLKTSHDGEGVALARDALDHVPAPGLRAARLLSIQRMANLVVTNVPGPRQPMYFLGSEVKTIVPVVPLGPNMGIGVAVTSYRDDLTIGIFADPDLCPDISAFAAALDAQFEAHL